MISIHPMVCHYKEVGGEIKTDSYVGVTDVLQHNFPTTFTFIIKLMDQIKRKLPDLSICHFISDSPSSQYRNRYACDMIARFEALFGVRATWSWLERSHGKGLCDGVGGPLKKLADSIIKTDKIVDSAEKFYQEVSQATTTMTLLKMDREQIEENSNLISGWSSPPVKGLMNAHMAAGIDRHL